MGANCPHFSFTFITFSIIFKEKRNMKQNLKDLPDINKRIQDIINEKANGNVRRFSMNMGLPDSSKINRLFNKDKRTNEYPMPSTDIVLLISNTYDYTTDWILKGIDYKEEKHINNIDIRKNDVDGDNNNTLIDSNYTTSTDSLMGLINKQQEQISDLIKALTNG